MWRLSLQSCGVAVIWLSFAVMAVQLSVGSIASAAVPTREQSIVEGALFDLSPFSFTVRFASSVDLIDAHLVDQDGKVTPIDLSFSRTRAALFVLELPVLVPHAYRLYWRIRDRDGAHTQGSVGFVVKGCDDPKVRATR